MTDLTNVPDHPVRLLRSAGDRYGGEYLDTWERTNNVTFVACQNELLADIRLAAEKMDRAPFGDEEWTDAARDLKAAIHDMLGLS